MAEDWTALLDRWLGNAEEAISNADVLWRDFERRATVSGLSVQVREWARLGRPLGAERQYLIAVVCASIGAELDLTVQQEVVRQRLSIVMDQLVAECAVEKVGALVVEKGSSSASLYQGGWSMLSNAADLVRGPVLKASIKVAASLANEGLRTIVMELLGSATASIGTDEPRGRFVMAFERYAEEAGSMNAAFGDVLFSGLGLRLG